MLRREPNSDQAWQMALVTTIQSPLAATRTAAAFSALLQEAGAPEVALAAPETRARFGLYRELVRNGFRGALEVSIPRTLARSGAGRIEADLDAFIAARRSRSPYFRDLASEFVNFVAERWQTDPSVAPYLLDLARHEVHSFEIAAAPDDDERSAAADPCVASRLRFQRAARLVRYAHAVHLLAENDDLSLPEPRACSVLGYRDADGAARFLELSDLAHSLLSRLMRGESLGEASLRSLEDTASPMDDTTLADVAVLLEDLERRGALLGAAD